MIENCSDMVNLGLYLYKKRWRGGRERGPRRSSVREEVYEPM